MRSAFIFTVLVLSAMVLPSCAPDSTSPQNPAPVATPTPSPEKDTDEACNCEEPQGQLSRQLSLEIVAYSKSNETLIAAIDNTGSVHILNTTSGVPECEGTACSIKNLSPVFVTVK